MKFLLSSILALAIASVPVRVQEPDDKSKPQEEPKKKPPEPKPGQQPDEKPKAKPEKPPKQEPQQPDEKQKQQKEQSKTDRKSRQPEQAESAKPGSTRQAPAKGQRIPPERFRASFGHEHHFRVARSGGDNRRFQYGGYWFEVVEVWPAGWAFDDDCYIEEDGDDYYLVDLIHPQLRVLVIVVSA